MVGLFARAEILFLVFTSHLVLHQVVSEVYIDGSKALKRDAGDGVAYANFAAHKSRSLNLAPLLVALVKELRECGKLCVDHSSCFSANLAAFHDQDGRIMCELLPSDKYNNSKKFVDNSTFHHLSIKNPCLSDPCMYQAPCVANYEDDDYQCTCAPGYRGKNCQIAAPTSCKEIDSMTDGEYLIYPERNVNPLKVFCDMTKDGGGWLLVSNVVIDSLSSPPLLSIETTYRGISNYNNNNTSLTTNAMNELMTHSPFTQIRFHCSKQRTRTFHITTTTNSTGEAVVQYFSGQTDVQPDACGSFVTMVDDNSILPGECQYWGKENNAFNVGKWGDGAVTADRLFRFPIFRDLLHYWVVFPDGSKSRCDDNSNAVSPGDFWKVFVR